MDCSHYFRNGEVIVGDFFGLNVSGIVVSKKINDIQ